MLRQWVAGYKAFFRYGDPMRSEKLVRRTMKRLAGQRVALVLQPGNVWVIERAVEDNERTDAALKTAYMRGWVEPLQNSVAKGRLGPNGELPPGELYDRIGTIWRLTESGWNIVNRTHGWTRLAIFVAVLSLVMSIGSLIISLGGFHR